VGPNLELLPRLAVDVRAAQHSVALDAGRQRDRAADDGAGSLGRVNYVVGGTIQHFAVESLHADADTLVREACQRCLSLSGRLLTAVDAKRGTLVGRQASVNSP